MGDIFNPQEILKIAISVEGSGRKLYEALENKARDEKLKSTWRYLKEQEEIHQEVFQKMLDKVRDYIVYEFNPGGEYEAYLKAIASEYIFTQELTEKKLKEGFSSALDAVEFGIYVEKESILTYSAFREYVLTAKQAILDKVITEEKRHFLNLISIKNSLKKGE